MSIVDINVLIHERAHFTDMTVKSLSKITQKDKVRVNFLCTGEPSAILQRSQKELQDCGIATNIVPFHISAPSNFKHKIRWMCCQPARFIIRVDDDCFAPAKTWDSLISSIDILEHNNKVLCVIPVVSNSIPGFEYFAESFFTKEERNKLYQMVLANPVLTKWEIDYSDLAPAFENDTWDADAYYNLLYHHGNDRLGVHPVRFTEEIQKCINATILNRWDDFMNPPDNDEVKLVNVSTRPYYCNTCFLIRTAIYRDIIDRKDLDRDAFEEIPFNLYRREKKLQFAFLSHAWMINFYYRSLNNHTYLENQLHTSIMQKLRETTYEL